MEGDRLPSFRKKTLEAGLDAPSDLAAHGAPFRIVARRRKLLWGTVLLGIGFERDFPSSPHPPDLVDERAVSDLVEIRRSERGIPLTSIPEIHHSEGRRLDQVVLAVGKPRRTDPGHGSAQADRSWAKSRSSPVRSATIQPRISARAG